MAASDPTTDVPTPTGTLQGVAAFSWDGSAWQPAGRAGPSVATPTGALRGVAAFNGGPAWQPSGRAQPGVATPTGTLDGIAVYTWSGAAWTPPGGTATPSTPSGALRGVAAFNWDGAAWQPAGQAGPSVATPYGVLDGVAMFNWTGSAWAATGAPSLSLDFMTPGTLDPRITFTRASTATYFNNAGVMQTAAINAPRWDYNPSTQALNGLLIEEQRTNTVLNSAALGQALWNYTSGALGAAVVAPDGTTTGATLIGADANSRIYQQCGPVVSTNTITISIWLKAPSPVTARLGFGSSGVREVVTLLVFLTTVWQRFIVTATGLASDTGLAQYSIYFSDGTNPVTINAWGAQLEVGAFPTSYIPTTAAAVTRSADLASMPTAAWFNMTNGTYQAEFIPNGAASTLPVIISGNAGSPVIATGADSRLVASIRSGAAVFSATGPLYTFGAVNKAAFGYLSGASTAAVNGTAIGPGATALTVTGTAVEFGSDGVTPGNNALDGWLRRIQYWPRVLSNAEMQSVTT